MTPQEFIDCIMNEIVAENLAIYDGLLHASANVGVKDPTWQRIRSAFEQMSEDQRAVARQLVRQVMIDTISNILGILDGTTILRAFREEFALVYGEDRTQLNGVLQDLFLATVERERP